MGSAGSFLKGPKWLPEHFYVAIGLIQITRYNILQALENKRAHTKTHAHSLFYSFRLNHVMTKYNIGFSPNILAWYLFQSELFSNACSGAFWIHLPHWPRSTLLSENFRFRKTQFPSKLTMMNLQNVFWKYISPFYPHFAADSCFISLQNETRSCAEPLGVTSSWNKPQMEHFIISFCVHNGKKALEQQRGPKVS